MPKRVRSHARMILRLCFLAWLVLALASCESMHKSKKPKRPKEPAMQDVNGDVSFQAFLGRLRKAVGAHDVPAIAAMMSSDFGYRMEPPGEGEGVFQYWDEKGLWPELEMLLRERFVPKGQFMVAPSQFALDPDFHGYRAGITLVNGSWKFAYFASEQ